MKEITPELQAKIDAVDIYTFNGYTEAALRTDLSPEDYAKSREAFLDSHSMMMNTLRILFADGIKLGSDFDVLKRAIYYDASTQRLSQLEHNKTGKFPVDIRGLSIDYSSVYERLDENTLRLLHGILGSITEDFEILEALNAYIFEGKPLDTVNLLEENGDSAWYLNLRIQAVRNIVGFGGWAKTCTVNIKKLLKRFPEKFSGLLSINRDTESEQRLLEAEFYGQKIDATCPKCGHVWHTKPCLNMASDNDCNCLSSEN